MSYYVLIVNGKEKGVFRSEYEAITAAVKLGYKDYKIQQVDIGGTSNGKS